MTAEKKKRSKASAASDPIIPDKLYFRIGEVASLCRLPAYVLRFWETEFPQLKPVKSSTGQRMYRQRDVENVLRIKKLLYDEGFTIAGREPQLRNGGTHRHGHRAEMHGHVIAHGKHVAGCVKERAGVVATLFDVGREGRAAQRCAHLFRHRVKEMLEDFELDRVGPHDGASVPQRRARGNIVSCRGGSESPNSKGRNRFLKIFVDIPLQ
jgi:DNA-binding transcriptional MerR regulator